MSRTAGAAQLSKLVPLKPLNQNCSSPNILPPYIQDIKLIINKLILVWTDASSLLAWEWYILKHLWKNRQPHWQNVHPPETRRHQKNTGFSYCNSVSTALTSSQASECPPVPLPQTVPLAHQPDIIYSSSQVTSTQDRNSSLRISYLPRRHMRHMHIDMLNVNAGCYVVLMVSYISSVAFLLKSCYLRG